MYKFATLYTKRVLLVALAVLAFGVSPGFAQEVGDMAPDFALEASDGNTYTLAQFKGEKPVVISFFPKAFTGG